jgi:hypothetical protein
LSKPAQTDKVGNEVRDKGPEAAVLGQALSQPEADRFDSNFVGTEHLLLGLIKFASRRCGE